MQDYSSLQLKIAPTPGNSPFTATPIQKPLTKNPSNNLNEGQVKFGQFKARKAPKSLYERPSKRKMAKSLENSSFLSCSEDEMPMISVLPCKSADNMNSPF